MADAADVPAGEARLRGDARSMVEAALAAVDPEPLVADALAARPLTVPAGGRRAVVAVGKAAPGMLRGARSALGEAWPGEGRAGEAVAVVPRGLGGKVPAGVEVHEAGHPLPDETSVLASGSVRRAVAALGARDRLLLLLSGGGSALLSLPAEGIALDDLRAVTRGLLEAGAPIDELNAVRKHLEVLKGGGLARIASPAPVRALLISDVVGDRPDVVASGPVSPDPTTFADAVEVLRERRLWASAPAPVRARLEAGADGGLPETPADGDPVFWSVEVSVVGNAARAADAAVHAAGSLGYTAERGSVVVQGEAREVGARLGREARTRAERGGPACLVLAGETTVTVTGPGTGGRNQEVALGAAGPIAGLEGVLVFSVGTDGLDGPTDAAGAWVTGRTLERARARGLDPGEALRHNDAYPFFRALDDLVVTGPTGTNVMDLMGVLTRPPAPDAGSRQDAGE